MKGDDITTPCNTESAKKKSWIEWEEAKDRGRGSHARLGFRNSQSK